MLRPVLLCTLLGVVLASQAQTTHELTNAGTTFSPNVITMQPGDSIHLVLANPHTCTQVDQSTWEANGNTPNGGFNYPSGEHTFSLDVPGTYYYVCTPHAGMGMKGQIVVEDNTGVQEAADLSALKVSPNPARDQVQISGYEPGQTVQVLDLAGRKVMSATPSGDGLIDISALKAGTYNISVTDAQGRWNFITPLVIAQ